MKFQTVLQSLEYIVSKFKNEDEKEFMIYLFINAKPCIILNDNDVQTFIDGYFMSYYLADKQCHVTIHHYPNIKQLMIDIEVTI